MRASDWCVVINNPTPEDRASVKELPEGWKVYGQEEEGEEGTRHLQLYVHTGQVRGRQVKDHFPRAHIEKAENKYALKNYSQKEDTRVSVFKTNETEKDIPKAEQLWELLWEMSRMPGYVFEDVARHNDPIGFYNDLCSLAINPEYGNSLWVASFSQNPQIKKAWEYHWHAILDNISAKLDPYHKVKAIESIEPPLKDLEFVRIPFPGTKEEFEIFKKTGKMPETVRQTDSVQPKRKIKITRFIDDADDNEGTRSESGQVDSSSSEDEDQGSCKDETDSEGEGDSDSGQSTDSSDQESDASE